MIVHEYYPKDFRVRRESEALAEAGYNVSVISLRNKNESNFEIYNGVEIYRMPVCRHRGAPLYVYLFEYLTFFIFAGIKLSLLHFKKIFKSVQVHNPPDFLVFSALIPKLTGAKIIIDIHDKTSELFKSRFGTGYKKRIVFFIKFIEKLSAAFADKIITAVNVYKIDFIKSGVPAGKIEVILNTADEKYFSPTVQNKTIKLAPDINIKTDSILLKLFHHGTLVKRYGLDVLIKAAGLLKKNKINFVLDIYGEGDFYSELNALVKSLNLENNVFFHGFIMLDYLAEKIAAADLCVVPNRKDLFMDSILPTKLLEYILMEKPAIVSRTKGVEEYFSDKEITFVKPDSPEDLFAAVMSFVDNREPHLKKTAAAKQKYSEIEWKTQKEKLIDFYRFQSATKNILAVNE